MKVGVFCVFLKIHIVSCDIIMVVWLKKKNLLVIVLSVLLQNLL